MKMFAAVLCFALSIGCAHAQQARYISLDASTPHYALHQFHIHDVVDSTHDRDVANTTIGAVNGSEQAAVMFQAPLTDALGSFIRGNVKMDSSTVATTLVVNQMDVQLRKSKKGYSGTIKTQITFYAGKIRLVSLKTEGNVFSPVFPAVEVQQVIKKILKGNLDQFDKWMEDHRDEIALDSIITVNLVIGRDSPKPGYIYYNPGRKLEYGDFQGEVPGALGQEAAVTASGIGIEYNAEIKVGKMFVNITLTPAFDKSKSWFRQDAKNEHVLAHEQVHFDITALKTCEWAAAIRAAHLTRDNFDKEIAKMQDFYAEAAKQQEETYDAETNHGLITEKQREWEAKLEKAIPAAGCW